MNEKTNELERKRQVEIDERNRGNVERYLTRRSLLPSFDKTGRADVRTIEAREQWAVTTTRLYVAWRWIQKRKGARRRPVVVTPQTIKPAW